MAIKIEKKKTPTQNLFFKLSIKHLKWLLFCTFKVIALRNLYLLRLKMRIWWERCALKSMYIVCIQCNDKNFLWTFFWKKKKGMFKTRTCNKKISIVINWKERLKSRQIQISSFNWIWDFSLHYVSYSKNSFTSYYFVSRLALSHFFQFNYNYST